MSDVDKGEMLPCPFCGDTAYTKKWDNGYRTGWKVVCSDGCCERTFDASTTHADAIKTWNTRAYLAAAKPEGDAYEGAVQAVASKICETVNKLNGEAYTPLQWMGAARTAVNLAWLSALPSGEAARGPDEVRLRSYLAGALGDLIANEQYDECGNLPVLDRLMGVIRPYLSKEPPAVSVDLEGLVERLRAAAVDGSAAARGWRYVLLASACDIVSQHTAAESTAGEEEL